MAYACRGSLPAPTSTKPSRRTSRRCGCSADGGRCRWLATLLDDQTARDLHRAMFAAVWKWAGTYRLRDANIGSHWPYISIEVRNLMADALLWVTGTTPMPADEAACRLHHQLVSIHPFPNGNGRHCREVADVLLRALDTEAFTWGRTSLVEASRTRKIYIAALRRADDGDLDSLLDFARS